MGTAAGDIGRKLSGLIRRGARHPQWALENVRLARRRRGMHREYAEFRLDDFAAMIRDEREVMAQALDVSQSEYEHVVSGLWMPRQLGREIETWDSRDGLLRIVGAVVRITRPETLVETGVARGYTSATALAAMEENGTGHLHSVDLPPLTVDQGFIGQAIPERLKNRWTLHVGPSKSVLPGVVAEASPIDVFLHDADHTYDSMREEFETAWPRIRSGGLLLSDDVANRSFTDFASEVGLRPQLIPRHENSAFGVLRKP